MRIVYVFLMIFFLPAVAWATSPVSICIPQDNPPFAFTDANDGQLKGLDIDILAAIQLDVDYNTHQRDFASSLAGLSNTECDMVLSNVIINEKRQQRFLFSKPLLKSGLYAAVLQESPINDINTLQYSIIGVLKGSVAEEYAFSQLKGSIIYALRDNSNIISMLNEGAVEAILDSLPILQTLQKSNPQVRILEPSLQEEQFAYAFAKEHADLRDKFDLVLSRLQEDGSLARIYEKWLGNIKTDDAQQSIF